MKPHISIIVLNWNGKEFIEECLDSLVSQTLKPEIVVVDNGSKDGSVELIERKYKDIHLIKESVNHGFAGGVNIGIKYALSGKADAVALFNNDAVAEKDWLENLNKELRSDAEIGAVGGKLLRRNGELIDSTGDLYSVWGLPIARQRNDKTPNAVSKKEVIFGATAGACLYRATTLRDVGNFDEKFFAYYEDTDFNFRIQLRGWKIVYTPKAVAYHKIGGTSSRISGFTTLQTMKNLPMLFFKNMPLGLMFLTLPRFALAYYLVFFNSLFQKDRRWPAIKGHFLWLKNILYIIAARHRIQNGRKVSNAYVRSILYNDLPPDAHRLRRFRSFITLGRT